MLRLWPCAGTTARPPLGWAATSVRRRLLTQAEPSCHRRRLGRDRRGFRNAPQLAERTTTTTATSSSSSSSPGKPLATRDHAFSSFAFAFEYVTNPLSFLIKKEKEFMCSPLHTPLTMCEASTASCIGAARRSLVRVRCSVVYGARTFATSFSPTAAALTRRPRPTLWPSVWDCRRMRRTWSGTGSFCRTRRCAAGQTRSSSRRCWSRDRIRRRRGGSQMSMQAPIAVVFFGVFFYHLVFLWFSLVHTCFHIFGGVTG